MQKILLISLVLVPAMCSLAGTTCNDINRNPAVGATGGSFIPCGITLTSAPGTDDQTVCINTPITDITYSTSTQTQAVTFSGLPAGVTGSYDAQAHLATISGTPTETGVYTYTVTASGMPCSQSYRTGIITVKSDATIALTSDPGTTNQTVCINTPITNITYFISGAGTGADVTGLPSGVTGAYFVTAHTFRIMGTPTATGTFNYTVTTTGGTCAQATATGTITVNADATIALTSPPGTDNQSVCVNTPIANITYSIGGSGTGATATGLPPGVAGVYNAGVFTISGAPTGAGAFSYTVTATGICPQSATGTITVKPDATIALTSDPGTTNQTVCINTPITNITYFISGGGTGAEVTGLPPGVYGAYFPTFHTFRIMGTPTAAGTFNYTVTTTGTCVQATATGIITVNPAATISLTSASGTDNQTICMGNPITNITYLFGGGGALGTLVGLPDGVNWQYNDSVLTLSGSPTFEGTFNYTVTTLGTVCDGTATGSIIVNPTPNLTIMDPSDTTQQVCINKPIDDIVFGTGISSTGAYAEGLPTGVWGYYLEITNQFFIGGTPTDTGMFHYTVHATGTYCEDSITGSIRVDRIATISLFSPPGTDNQTVCQYDSIVTITYLVIADSWQYWFWNSTPAGLNRHRIWQNPYLYIYLDGQPTETGTFNYRVTVGACGYPEVYGTITVFWDASITLVSGTANQSVVLNNAITTISYSIGGGATGVNVTGLPPGVESSYNPDLDLLTIFGTPTETGIFTYMINSTGLECDDNASGVISVFPYANLSTGTETVTGVKCYEATQTIFVAGEDHTFKVMNGGSATMIAGHNIFYRPVTKVFSGGYMHGFISNNYCGFPLSMPVVASTTSQEEPLEDFQHLFKIYPNPTTGTFTLELASEPGKSPVSFHCYNLMGSLVMVEKIYSGQKHEFTLANQAPGIYLLRVTRDGETGVRKIIRQ